MLKEKIQIELLICLVKKTMFVDAQFWLSANITKISNNSIISNLKKSISNPEQSLRGSRR